MTTYISILRGINVSGQKSIRMIDLKALYESLGFTNVITYIQSGNVIFKTSSELNSNELAQKIEQAILKKYNFEVPVIIRSVKEWNIVTKNNPFIAPTIEEGKLYVTFLNREPDKILLDSINKLDFTPEQFKITGKEIYLYCPNGYGNTKLSNNFFEKKLKTQATTRNWNTVLKLLELTK